MKKCLSKFSGVKVPSVENPEASSLPFYAYVRFFLSAPGVNSGQRGQCPGGLFPGADPPLKKYLGDEVTLSAVKMEAVERVFRIEGKRWLQIIIQTEKGTPRFQSIEEFLYAN